MEPVQHLYMARYNCVFGQPCFSMQIPISIQTLPGKMKMLEFIINDHMASLYISGHIIDAFVDCFYDDWTQKYWVKIYGNTNYIPSKNTLMNMYHDVIERCETIIRYA